MTHWSTKRLNWALSKLISCVHSQHLVCWS
ncbi:unnamed protein product [Toxocara canis]|uniref:Uncharacterized protein n=1 Tax=Toxocara canis TaxID=6265 RepID=A0A183U764_TOXCA|nr:unnamed protein product [Toxocara canis]